MALDLATDCTFTGPALPEPFVKFNLEAELNRLSLLPKATGPEARTLAESWPTLRRKLASLVAQGGALRVQNQVIEPLVALLGYSRIESAPEVVTREGAETGGALLTGEDGSARLRCWCVDLDADLDAPGRRGLAYRFSPTRIAQRVLLAGGERLGMLTNGRELRLLISDPARVDSAVAISLDPYWRRSREVPDSLRLLMALASPAGVKALPDLLDKARLQQAKVTKDLREQARNAIREFIQELLDHPSNQAVLVGHADRAALAKDLWHEGLITVYRLLFVLKLESTDDPARSFSFASTSLWRNTFSPSVALAPIVRRVLDHGAQTGRVLQDGLRSLFRLLADGLQCSELHVRPMAGALFAPAATPILGSLEWPELAIARLLDNLLWTRGGRGANSRERVHYGPLDVEDLGRVYEALLELEPGIAAEPMCRLRRAKLEVVVPVGQGERYRPAGGEARMENGESGTREADSDEAEAGEEEAGEAPRGKKTKVEWIEEIPAGRFYLRVGLGRKATGSYYTPHSFVRFLVKETLGPLVQRASPAEDPQPCAILKLKIIDKAMGSGHFLVEASRFLGDALYDAARRCDELAAAAEKLAESYRASAKTKADHQALAAEQEARAAKLRQRVMDLPDPDDELLRYLPSRSVEGTAGGVSHNKALALCRRMVAVHCLYGVDKNPLAVELAKLALWIECHAEGLPLTFLDHRLVVGDSLTGPLFEHLLKYPGSQQPLDDLFSQGLKSKLTAALADALQHVRALEATVGVTLADIEAKQAAKTRLDHALAPFKILAAAWSGGVMLGTEGCDDTAYAALAKHIAENGNMPEDSLAALGNHAAGALLKMVAKGLGLPAVSENVSDFRTMTADLDKNAIPALSFELVFPEVFYPDGNLANRVGFDADLGNPPWDKPHFEEQKLFASFEPDLLDVDSREEWEKRGSQLLESRTDVLKLYNETKARVAGEAVWVRRHVDLLEATTNGKAQGHIDLYFAFVVQAMAVLRPGGAVGMLVGGGWAKNPAARELRVLLMARHHCLYATQFDNKHRLFADLPGILEFCMFLATVTDKNQSAEVITRVGVKLTKFEQLLVTEHLREVQRGLLRSLAAGGDQLSLGNLVNGNAQLRTEHRQTILGFVTERSGKLIQEINLSADEGVMPLSEAIPDNSEADPRFEPHLIALRDLGIFPLLNGRSVQDYDGLPTEVSGRWSPVPTHLVRVSTGKVRVALQRAQYYRIGFRRKCGSPKSNERSMRAAIVPGGFVCSDSLLVEESPTEHSNVSRLELLAVLNSFAVDGFLRPKVQVMLGEAILDDTPAPALLAEHRNFLAHSALRLTCNHAGYAPLWREQLGEAWREPGAAFRWPALSGDEARWAVRAAIDAVVAHAYRLTRDQYAHVLSTFSHASYKDAPRKCLAAFDELLTIGLEAFSRKHDPYWDIPLNENLPKPVIDLPGVANGEWRTGNGAGGAGSPRTGQGELFGFETGVAPAGSDALFVERPVTRARRKG